MAKVSANGQITVPADIRRVQGLREGDKILFMQNENAEIVVNNASSSAIVKAQEAFAGVAELLVNPSEDEIQKWVNEIRYGKRQPE